MDKKYLRIVYKHYDFAELEVQPKSKFIKDLMTNDETVKYDFGLCFEAPEDISEDKIKQLCSCCYNLMLKENNVSKKASSMEIRKFNEDFVVFGTTEFLPAFGFKLLSVEQEKTLKVMKEKKVKQISEELNINYDNLNALSRRMSLNRAVNIIKYYGDKEDELGNKFVSSSTINYLQLLLDKVKNSSDEISVYELFRLYKCKLYDTRGIIVYRKNKDINDLIDNLYKNYNEKISNLSKDDFVNIVEFAYIDSLDVLELTSEKDFDRNVKKYVQEKFKNYISIYSDYGANTSKRVKFDSLKIDAEDKKFIILRINKKYSYNALAKYYGVKVNDIIEKEKKILKKISKTIERKARKN